MVKLATRKTNVTGEVGFMPRPPKMKSTSGDEQKEALKKVECHCFIDSMITNNTDKRLQVPFRFY